uniref:NADH dehydrogenase subunit 6 n=1 Tax=Tropostreptus kipunji TaxID=2931682 RepID=A0A8T9JAE4_9MYRI|nr:NADH dehydrogenase subunit 6 [Tropostreptus kipunji]UOF70199.1 NADH dehydrogenase subunit 6 [Tropostreptus kipunji]UOF70303.1 NADH dehydrogenase subunit 6 [Tropostreptus kipunji]
MFTMTLLMMTLTILFPFMFHPMMMGITIIVLALTISMFMWMTLNYSWLAYILFLIFLGALLVLFVYISTLAPNEKFLKMSYSPLLLLTFMVSSPTMYTTKDINMTEVDFLPSMKIFSISLSLMTLFMAIYLLLTLLIISKITLFKEGPLRTST